MNLQMRLHKYLLSVVLIIAIGCSESSIDNALKKYNRGSVPYIQVEELSSNLELLLLDTREKEEYDVSHIPGAHWVGYKTFSIDQINEIIPDTTKRVVVYCSVGVRSEDIGELLLQNGYKDVKNLYGGIFEWKNRGLPVVDSKGRETQNVHAFSKYWSKLLTQANKVY